MTISRKATMFVSALAAATLIAGCSSGDDGNGGDGGDNGGTPNTAVDQLAVNSEDVEGITLNPVSADALRQTAEQLGQIVDQMDVQPEECRAATNLQSATMTKSVENAAARSASLPAEGESPAAEVSLTVAPAGEPNPERQTIAEKCGEMQMTLPIPDGEPVSYTLRNEKLDMPAPENVENFLALKQSSDGQLNGQQATAGGVVLTGTVRGIEINVTTQVNNGAVDPGLETKTLDLFTAQAQKIQDAE